MSTGMQDMYHYFLPFLYGLTHVSKVGSVFTTLAVSLERYFAVCRPLWIRIRRCHPALYIVLVTGFAVAFNIPKFLEFQVRYRKLSAVCLHLWSQLGKQDMVHIPDFCILSKLTHIAKFFKINQTFGYVQTRVHTYIRQINFFDGYIKSNRTHFIIVFYIFPWKTTPADYVRRTFTLMVTRKESF